MKFVTPNIAVEIKLRPINPETVVKRPHVILKDKQGNDVVVVRQPKVVMGINQQDGREVFGYPLMICPKCHGNGKYPTVVATNTKTQESYTMPKALYEMQKPRFPETEWRIEENPKEVKCDLCDEGQLKYFSNYEQVKLANGQHVASEEIVPWAMQEDGKLEQFPYYPRSETLQVQFEIPASKRMDYLWDGGFAELEAPTIEKKIEGKKVKVPDRSVEQLLWKECERYIAENVIGVGRFVKARSHKDWFFVVMPTVTDADEFGWLVGYTTSKIIRKHTIPIPSKTEIANEVKVPTKSYLDIEALVK